MYDAVGVVVGCVPEVVVNLLADLKREIKEIRHADSGRSPVWSTLLRLRKGRLVFRQRFGGDVVEESCLDGRSENEKS